MRMDTNAMHMTSEGSEAGKLRFPEVVKALTEVGVESYYSDLITGTKTFYMPNGETHSEKLSLAPGKIAEDFSQAALVAAIRAAQADEIRYPEFLKRAVAAGTASYRVCLTGKRAVYLGRKGEVHVEEFPRAKD
jgi:uncharacterized protein YbcV (DUF1398 family)